MEGGSCIKEAWAEHIRNSLLATSQAWLFDLPSKGALLSFYRNIGCSTKLASDHYSYAATP